MTKKKKGTTSKASTHDAQSSSLSSSSSLPPPPSSSISSSFYSVSLFFLVIVVSSIPALYTSEDFRNNFQIWNEYLESAFIKISKHLPPLSVLDMFGSILACRQYRLNMHESGARRSWFEVLVSCTILQFGGTTLTGFLLGQTPSWIISKTAFPAFITCWWLTFCCPLDLFWRIVPESRVLLFFIGLGSAISSAHAVTSWGVDKALKNAFHVNTLQISQSWLTCVLSGALSASGGGLIADWWNLLEESSSSSSSKLGRFTTVSTPRLFAPVDYWGVTATLNRSFMLSVLYVLIVFKDGATNASTIRMGHAVITILQVTNFLIRQINSSVDVFQIIRCFILWSLRIPPVLQFESKKLSKKQI